MDKHACRTWDYFERCLFWLSSAEVHRLKDISRQAQSSTTTTTNNNDGVRDRSSVNVGEHRLGVGKCMSYINVDGFQ